MRLSTRTSPSMPSMVFPLRSALKLKEISYLQKKKNYKLLKHLIIPSLVYIAFKVKSESKSILSLFISLLYISSCSLISFSFSNNNCLSFTSFNAASYCCSSSPPKQHIQNIFVTDTPYEALLCLPLADVPPLKNLT